MSEIYNGTFLLGNTSATTLSAGPGIKIDTSVPGTIKISNDETVLWEGTAFNPAGSNNPLQTSVQLSEDVFNFTKLQLEFSGGQVFRECITVRPYTGNDAIYYNYKTELDNPLTYIGTKYKLTDSTTLSGKCSYGNTQNIDAMTGGYWNYGGVCRVIGINRISGGN